MKKSVIKVLSVLLVVVITLTSAPLSGLVGIELPEWLDFSIVSKAAEISGKCGENVYWNFDETTGLLTITGTGAMNESLLSSTWKDYKESIKNVVITNGVTTIGEDAFAFCENLTNVNLPNSITYIGECAFLNCISLKEIIIPEGVKVIYDSTFNYCKKLSSVILPNSLQWIDESAFNMCESLTNIVIPYNVVELRQGAFANCQNLVSVTLYNNMERFHFETFWGSYNISDVYYIGTEEEWKSIKSDGGNSNIYGATIHYIIESGKCGINLTWAFNNSTGTLTISGTGDMYRYYDHESDYCDDGDFPWNHIKNDIKTIIIGEGVTQICDVSFAGCTNLTYVELPKTLKEIGAFSFENCTSLTEILISADDINIERRAFSGCDKLSELIFGDGVISVGDYAFEECSSLTNVTISQNVELMGEHIFSKCSGLTSVDINVKSISCGTFENCVALTDVMLSNNVVSILDGAFWGCASIENIEIPTSVKTIEHGAFERCTKLTDVYYLGSQEQWNNIYIASYNSPLHNATVHYNIETGKCGDNLTWTFEKTTGTLTISGKGDMYRYYDVSSDYCDDGDFPWNHIRKDIKEIIVDDGVTQVCDFSFANCTNLTSVTFPKTLDEIGAFSFENCTSLTNVSILGYNTGIEKRAFFGCKNISKLILGDGVKSIGEYAFGDCNSLMEITVGDNITGVGKNPFAGSAWCDNIDNWKDGVLYLGNYLIKVDSENISDEYTIKTGTRVIASEAFINCNKIKKINFPDGLVNIGSRAFYQCYNLQGIDIPSSVSNIGAYAFYGCSQITSVTIPKGITHISDGVFWWCCNLTTVTIPQSVTYVGLGSFCDCDNIKDVYYYGTEEEWKAIVRDAGNDIFGANVHFHEHIYNEWEITKEPTCLNRGYKFSFCDCGKRNGVYTDALGHDIIIDEAVNPDCINTGLTVGEHCSRCDYKIEQTVIEVLGHKYDTVITVPTCTERGYTTYTCSVCGDTYTSDYVDALGHTIGEIIEENYIAPTCTINGSKDNVTYCTVCNTETSRVTITVPVLGHTEEEIHAVEPTCTETGLTTGVKCSVCDEIQKKIRGGYCEI